MKHTYYFSHDSNARTDAKILALRSKYGARGYGVYWMIVEMLREASAYRLPKQLETIAYEVHEDVEMVTDIVENFSLFKIKDGYFFSQSLKSRVEKYDEMVKKRRISGKIGGEANAKRLLKQNRSNSVASKVKESKVKESIIVSEQARSINSFIELFKEVNPSYKRLFANTTQRSALERLLKEHGEDRVKELIAAISTTNGKKYAPVITTPLELETKLGILGAFIQKELQKSSTIIA